MADINTSTGRSHDSFVALTRREGLLFHASGRRMLRGEPCAAPGSPRRLPGKKAHRPPFRIPQGLRDTRKPNPPIDSCMSHASATVAIHKISHRGQRDENQDRVIVLDSPDGDAHLLAVADGLGGHSGGLLAARTVVRTSEECWRDRDVGEGADAFLEKLVRESHAAVRRAGSERNLDPQSTLAALLLEEGKATSVHCGDSRVMQFSDTEFVKRTLDHSMAQLHALRGVISEEEIATHPDQNRLFTSVGGPGAPEVEITRWDLSKGRRFVVCSDGFWEIFPPDEMLDLFASGDPSLELERRVECKLESLERHDNTSAILVEVTRAPRGESLPLRGDPPDAPDSTEPASSPPVVAGHER